MSKGDHQRAVDELKHAIGESDLGATSSVIGASIWCQANQKIVRECIQDLADIFPASSLTGRSGWRALRCKRKILRVLKNI